jgi:hypothetical protein
MSGNFLLIYICNFHVLSHLLLNYICKLHWMQGRVFFDEYIEALSTFVSVCRRVGLPKLPVEVWTQGVGFTLEDLSGMFPFAEIWGLVLPTVMAALMALHGLWDPSIRLVLMHQQLPAGYTLQHSPGGITSPANLASLYDPSIGGGKTGMNIKHVANTFSFNYRYIYYLRRAITSVQSVSFVLSPKDFVIYFLYFSITIPPKVHCRTRCRVSNERKLYRPGLNSVSPKV